ncbi:MAG: flavin reductase family protein [Actinomycetota bacterium]|nr:flavin reductase family protein [Actinomycetota bacterium]
MNGQGTILVSDYPPATRAAPPPGPSAEALNRAFRGVMSCFPTGVAVITAQDERSEQHGMTCTSLASVTLDPATVAVCLDCGSGTLAAVRASGAFGLNLLRAQARGVAEIFASPVPDRFGRVPWRPGERTGVPWLIRDACAFAECEVAGLLVVGDHAIVLGQVVRAVSRPNAPLLYGNRTFAGWPPDSDLLAECAGCLPPCK